MRYRRYITNRYKRYIYTAIINYRRTFAEITKNSVELSVAEKIWLLIVEVINVIAEAFNCDAMALTEQIISNDKQIKAVKEAFDKLAVVA